MNCTSIPGIGHSGDSANNFLRKTVGDTRFDIEAAKKAGLKTIAFLCGGTPESTLHEVGAIAIYRDPADFLAHYDELMK